MPNTKQPMHPSNARIEANYSKLRKYWGARDTVCADDKQKVEFDNMFIAALSNSVDISEWTRLLDRATSAVIKARQ